MEEKQEETNILEKITNEVETIIKKICENGIDSENIDTLSKLIDIHKDIANEEYWQEKEEIMYRDYDDYSEGSYGRQGVKGTGMYSRYRDNSYGRRGVKGTGRGRYRGYDLLDEMMDHYGNYTTSKNTYGNEHESEKSFDKMLDCMEEFAFAIMEEANTPDKVEKIKHTARKISEM